MIEDIGSLGIQGVDTICTGWPCACPVWGNHKGCPYPTKSRRPAFLIMFIPGLLFIAQGVRMLRGKAKAWYFARHIYAGAVYGYIPLGIGSVCLALATVPESETLTAFLIYAGGFFGVVGVIFNFVRPFFLKPAWLRWLEERYGDMMPILKDEAHRMGLELWHSKMQTQADIEAWAEEVWRKHSKMRHEQRLKKRTF